VLASDSVPKFFSKYSQDFFAAFPARYKLTGMDEAPGGTGGLFA
jgi:hypothetical protein